MLWLRTGLPGSGKTLNAIKELDLEYRPDEKNPAVRHFKDHDHPELPPRTIYYFGIPDLKTDKLKSKWVEFDTPDEWYNLPDGSVIVVDEAQRVFRPELSKTIPAKCTRFETHRHQGLDIHLITQHPRLIHPHVRDLAGKHVNMYRPFGGTKVRRCEWENCVMSPQNHSQIRLADVSRIKLDKNYFGIYKSSTIHTHKKKLPGYYKLAWGLVALIFGLVSFSVWNIYRSVDDKKTVPADASAVATKDQPGRALQQPKPAESRQLGDLKDGAPMTTEQYVSVNTPRIADVPSSAPAYDKLTQPKDFPRLQCMSSVNPDIVEKHQGERSVSKVNGRETWCQCYSQQASKLNISHDVCIDVVQNGYFDATRQPAATAM